MLDEKGRCCGRKPMVYKSKWSTNTGPCRYCPRCDRAYGLEYDSQIDNWAWKRDKSGEFISQTNRKGV